MLARKQSHERSPRKQLCLLVKHICISDPHKIKIRIKTTVFVCNTNFVNLTPRGESILFSSHGYGGSGNKCTRISKTNKGTGRGLCCFSRYCFSFIPWYCVSLDRCYLMFYWIYCFKESDLKINFFSEGALLNQLILIKKSACDFYEDFIYFFSILKKNRIRNWISKYTSIIKQAVSNNY